MMRLMRSYLVPVSSSSLCLPKLRFYLGLFREGKHLGILSWWYQRPVYSRREWRTYVVRQAGVVRGDASAVVEFVAVGSTAAVFE